MKKPRRSLRDRLFGRFLNGVIKSIAQYEGAKVDCIAQVFADAIDMEVRTFERYRYGRTLRDPNGVRILAEIAVHRGYVNRQWLKHFLEYADYPKAERMQLIEQLCGSSSGSIIVQLLRAILAVETSTKPHLNLTF